MNVRNISTAPVCVPGGSDLEDNSRQSVFTVPAVRIVGDVPSFVSEML